MNECIGNRSVVKLGLARSTLRDIETASCAGEGSQVAWDACCSGWIGEFTAGVVSVSRRVSCKHRGFCPACGSRRMADTAAWLVDRVFPEVPVRQWVLALPYPVRFLCAFDPPTAGGVRVDLRACGLGLLRQGCTPPRGRMRQGRCRDLRAALRPGAPAQPALPRPVDRRRLRLLAR
jgi:hypothetical protein